MVEEVRNGYHEVTIEDVGDYKGELKDNMPHGQGRMVYQTGVIFEGEWKDGWECRGIYTHPGKFVYEGEMEGGIAHGQGKLTFANGGYYEGGHKKGAYHGIGIFFYADKNDPDKRREGEWKNDRFYTGIEWMFGDPLLWCEGTYVMNQSSLIPKEELEEHTKRKILTKEKALLATKTYLSKDDKVDSESHIWEWDGNKWIYSEIKSSL
jgi:hypothetical protein